MKIEVNGDLWELIEQPTVKTPRINPIMATLIMMSGGEYTFPSERKQLPPVANFVAEYGLIQLKKSKLSRSERERVVRYFERNFKKVTHDH